MQSVSFDVLPNFFIIGAEKAGTTTFFNGLKQHSQIYLPFSKDRGYFSKDELFMRGIDWYVDTIYKGANNYSARGDASVQYLIASKKVAPRIKETYGEQKVLFIAIFRDPVERAYSAYWHKVREGSETISFSEALLAEALQNPSEVIFPRRYYFHAGCYAKRLEPFLQHFPHQNFLFILYEDLTTAFARTMKQSFQFLGVDSRIAVKQVWSNPASIPRSRQFQQWLRQPYGLLWEVVKPLSKIAPYSLRRKVKRRLKSANLRRFSYTPIDERVAMDLRARYKDEIRRFEEIIGRDLSHWYEQ